MDAFKFRDRVIEDYQQFARSFTDPRADDIRKFLDQAYDSGRYWPSPLIQVNPSYVPGENVEELAERGVLHAECATIFRFGKEDGGRGTPAQLYKHQQQAIDCCRKDESYVLTTGTGSGKSLSYFIPIFDAILRQKEQGDAGGIKAVVIYPMNALANSQRDELEKFLSSYGTDSAGRPVTYARYTGQEDQDERERVRKNPPDIILTNFMMLELLMTRQNELDRAVIQAARGLKFLVLDELHTYRGRQGADVAMLVRRVRERLNPDLLCIGTCAARWSRKWRPRYSVRRFSRTTSSPKASSALRRKSRRRMLPPSPKPSKRAFRAIWISRPCASIQSHAGLSSTSG